jgi:signal peptide peptidase SppA
MSDSIFYTASRSFLKSFFSIIGFLLGIVAIIALIGGLVGKADEEPEQNFDIEILANADNVRKTQPKEAPVILSIDISGTIGLDDLTKENIRDMLVESREGKLKDNRVKGILLIMETPGGTVSDADGIYHALKSYKEQYKVPVYAYVDGMCASGGMYVAAAADKVYSNDASLIGSIGVITPSFLNFTKLIDKFGVEALTLYAGTGKDEMNPLRPWKEGEQKPMQGLIDYFYAEFVKIVTANRTRVDPKKLVEEYGAYVYTAPKAKEIGFVDGIGYSRNQVLKLLLKEIGVEDDSYQVISMSSNNWLKKLFKSDSSLISGKVTHEVKLPPELDSKLNSQFLYLYR